MLWYFLEWSIQRKQNLNLEQEPEEKHLYGYVLLYMFWFKQG